MHHYWNAPKNLATVPGPTSVVIKSDCGLRMTLPAWRVVEWEQSAPAEPTIQDTCPKCVEIKIRSAAA